MLDCGFLYTSTEGVGLGMEKEKYELCTFCRIWGWFVRALYAVYVCIRITQYSLYFENQDSETVANAIILDLVFIVGMVMNHFINQNSTFLRKCTQQHSGGGMRAGVLGFFTKVVLILTILVWCAILAICIYVHDYTVNQMPENGTIREDLEVSAVLLSVYVHNIFVFGTSTFTLLLFLYNMYNVCFIIHRFNKVARESFQQKITPVMVRLLLADFNNFRTLISNTDKAFSHMVILWFIATFLYVVDLVSQCTLVDGNMNSNVQAIVPSAVRAGITAVLVLFASDLGQRLLHQTRKTSAIVKTTSEIVSSVDREAFDLLNSFHIDTFSSPIGIKVWGKYYLDRNLFLIGSAVICLISIVVGLICYYA